MSIDHIKILNNPIWKKKLHKGRLYNFDINENRELIVPDYLGNQIKMFKLHKNENKISFLRKCLFASSGFTLTPVKSESKILYVKKFVHHASWLNDKEVMFVSSKNNASSPKGQGSINILNIKNKKYYRIDNFFKNDVNNNFPVTSYSFDNYIYMSYMNLNTVIVLNKNYQISKIIGKLDINNLKFLPRGLGSKNIIYLDLSQPHGVLYDKKKLYICDSGNGNLIKITNGVVYYLHIKNNKFEWLQSKPKNSPFKFPTVIKKYKNQLILRDRLDQSCMYIFKNKTFEKILFLNKNKQIDGTDFIHFDDNFFISSTSGDLFYFKYSDKN